MSVTRLDPRIKQQIKAALSNFMYAHVNHKANVRLQEIIVANTTGSRYLHQSFSYKGAYFSFELKPPRFKNQRLLSELRPAMDAYLAEKKELEYNEIPFVLGFFNKVLNASDSMTDYLKLLPECVHRAVEPFMDIAWISWHLPSTLSDAQVEAFQLEHQDWIMLLKKRMVLDLLT